MRDTLIEALTLIGGLDMQVMEIVWLSLRVSLVAVFIGTLLSLPLGAWLAIARFPGRDAIVVVLNALMGIPSVVVGVLVYLLLSRSGPLGGLGLLYSPPAMIFAQVCLVIPLMASLTRQIVEDAWRGYALELRALGLSTRMCVMELINDCRYSLVVATLAGMGRAISEVGAVMIVGGNIDGFTRVMTTAIALETAKGDLPLSIALGTVLLAIVMVVNAAAYGVRQWAMKRYG
jgi:tungstate transport system permease protein